MHGRARLGLAVFGLGLVLAVPPPPARAFHTVFHYQVERVLIDGNVHGTRDGTPDLVEEFDDTLASTPFRALYGTSVVSDGALHLESPGTHLDLPGLGLELDQSDVLSISEMLHDGAGDARLEVYFRQATLGVNHFVHATFSVFNPNASESYFTGLAFTNYATAVASREDGAVVTGPAMFGHSVAGVFPNLHSVAGNSVLVSSATGAFVLALDYDDTAKVIVPTFSLDGGQTFQGGLDALAVPLFDGSGAGTAGLVIGADPRDLASGAPDLCPLGLALARASVSRSRSGGGRITIRAAGILDSSASTPFDPRFEGAQIMMSDDGTASSLVSLTGTTVIPAGTPGSGCDARDGWTYAANSRTYKYRNVSNAFPPSCVTGAAGGLRRIKIKVNPFNPWDTDWNVSFNHAPLPGSLMGPMNLTIVRGRFGTEDAGGACLAFQTVPAIPCTSNTAGSRVRCRQ